MEGFITETAGLDASKFPEGRSVVIDTAKVRGINSLGVRDWVRFLEELCRRAPAVVIRRLPPILVSQTSAILNFLAGARAESLLVPWECPFCGATAEQEHPVAAPVPASVPCAKCGQAMQLDDIVEHYTGFPQANQTARRTG